MSASYLLRAPGDEMDAWKAKASADGVAFAEWMRRAARAALTEPDNAKEGETAIGGLPSGGNAGGMSPSLPASNPSPGSVSAVVEPARLAGPDVGVPQTPEAEAVPHAASPDAPIVGASGPASTATLTEPETVEGGLTYEQSVASRAESGSVSVAKRKRHPLAKEAAPRKRTAVCPHRRAPEEFCSRCDA